VIWEDQYIAWRAAQDVHETDLPERAIIRATRNAARKGGVLDNSEAWAWVERAFLDERRWFVAAVFGHPSAPRRIADRLFRAGVLEKDPSANRWLIEPAVAVLGGPAALERLLGYLRDGSYEEKAGAASALYWVRPRETDSGYAELLVSVRNEMLRQFVSCPDLTVLRRIVPMLSMNPAHYSKDVAPLLKTAIAKARRHADDYVRHRIAVQLGEERALRPIPPSPAKRRWWQRLTGRG